MLHDDLTNYLYKPSTPLQTALRDLYRASVGMCLVIGPSHKLLGILTLGDLKAAMMRGLDPKTPLSSVMNTEFVSAPVGTPERALEKLAASPNRVNTGAIGRLPVLDAKGRVVALYVSKKSERNDRQTVLVTGGAGYLGSVLCPILLEKGYKVVVLDKLLFGDGGIKKLLNHPRFSLIKASIDDIGALVAAVPQADYVIHLAGIVGDPASALSPMQTMEENHFATKMLIELSKYYQVSRFVFASSCSVYGASTEVLDETSKLNPVSLYAQSKLYSERDLLHAAGKDFHPVILRFGTLYGLSPRMRFDLVANVMSACAYFNKEIMVNGGDQWRALLHIEDAARACVAALEVPLSVASG